jgi:hypothetical protein
MRQFFREMAIILLPANALLALALWCPNLTLTWVFFGLTVAWLPAAGFIGLYLDRRRHRAFIDDYDRSLKDGLRRISSLRYARWVRKVA